MLSVKAYTQSWQDRRRIDVLGLKLYPSPCWIPQTSARIRQERLPAMHQNSKLKYFKDEASGFQSICISRLVSLMFPLLYGPISRCAAPKRCTHRKTGIGEAHKYQIPKFFFYLLLILIIIPAMPPFWMCQSNTTNSQRMVLCWRRFLVWRKAQKNRSKNLSETAVTE
jgi:hypothetical protein